MGMKKTYLFVNFGGPRTSEEIAPFLEALLTDQDVVRTPLPDALHLPLFRWIARRRVEKIREDYALIGGASPIYRDTEALASHFPGSLTFHRYLTATHDESLRQIEAQNGGEIVVFPLFPQRSFATTGSIARLFQERLSRKALSTIRWIPSYPEHPAYIQAFAEVIRQFLTLQQCPEEEALLLFSAHGLPLSFIRAKDPYQRECEASFRRLAACFPAAKSLLSYQSKFGPGKWLKPYTADLCKRPDEWVGDRKCVVFIPLSFSSDHIETLFEIEYQYVRAVQEKGVRAARCPALNLSPGWIRAVGEILQGPAEAPTEALIRP
jgi:ferrochelatase